MDNFKREYEVLEKAIQCCEKDCELFKRWHLFNEKEHWEAIQYEKSKKISRFVNEKIPIIFFDYENIPPTKRDDIQDWIDTSHFEHEHKFQLENWKLYKYKYKIVNFIKKILLKFKSNINYIRMKYEDE